MQCVFNKLDENKNNLIELNEFKKWLSDNDVKNFILLSSKILGQNELESSIN